MALENLKNHTMLIKAHFKLLLKKDILPLGDAI
jgi:hypothetical protein